MRTPEGYRKRIRHYDEPGHAHYLTFSCFQNQPFLKSLRACQWLIEAIQAAKAAHPFDLWAWVFMPDHVHLLLCPRAGHSLSDILAAVKVPVGKKAAGWVRREAPQFIPRMSDVQPNGKRFLRFWQRGGGYDRNIVSAQELHEKIGYIHRNPVRRGLVQSPADWRWSSHAAWERGTDEPLPIDRSTVPPIDGAWRVI